MKPPVQRVAVILGHARFCKDARQTARSPRPGATLPMVDASREMSRDLTDTSRLAPTRRLILGTPLPPPPKVLVVLPGRGPSVSPLPSRRSARATFGNEPASNSDAGVKITQVERLRRWWTRTQSTRALSSCSGWHRIASAQHDSIAQTRLRIGCLNPF